MVFGFGKSKEASSSSSATTNSESEAIQDGAEVLPPKNNLTKPLDVVFLQDTTGSQGPYIQSACKAIRNICDKIAASAEIPKDQIRFGLIAFRDHPPQDRTYVTKNFGFTSDVGVMQKNLSNLVAAGGGDGPEAQTAALAEALDMSWSENAVKIVILITDAPPHGLGEAGDGFSESPDQNDPLEITRQMAEKGITLFVIACEPALSRWKHAVDFYTALSQITSGRMFPLLMADKLGDFIIGTAVETIETEKLISEFEQVIIDDVYSNEKPVDSVVNNLQEYIKSKGIQVNTVVVEDVYNPSSTATSNVAAWASSKTVGVGKGMVKEVAGARLQAKYAPAYESKISSFGRASLLSAAPTGFGGFGAAPPPPQAASVLAAPMLMKQDVSSSQTRRIVMQSMARNSTVTSDGMTSRKTGKVIPSADLKQKGPD